MTFNAWIKPTAATAGGVVFNREEGGAKFTIGVDSGTAYVEINGQRGAASAPLAVNAWRHLAVVVDATKTTLFLDGESAATLAAGLPSITGPGVIGAAENGFVGEIDEVQISRVARSLGWVQLVAFGQGEKGTKLLTLGADEQGHTSWLEGGHFGIIIKNLTTDAWIVIVLLGIMALISWFVMFSKVRYLNGISKGNAAFMDGWAQVANDLTVLDDADPETAKSLGGKFSPKVLRVLRKSSVYRIYHIGVEEIRHRIAADTANRPNNDRKGLAGRSIQAIRASLDGGLVRETQKINSLIVLLTICISGGPFLGLLGTVVGVMITFAEVAAAGEVNVNAIAPGIAAALLATVAGLAVAIPSLFGYNYILSRVKDATADMHVFIDEFVTRMAEFYRE
jgi:biopolymer transport protein ExbB